MIKSKSSMNKMKMIPCVKCMNPMPELRLTQYGYNYCINCSTEKPLVARFHTTGKGEEVMTGIQIMDQKTAVRLAEMDNATAGLKENIDLEMLDYDKDESAANQTQKEGIHNAMNKEDKLNGKTI
tara:strand:- start:142 stop:516 length:375 start_codon:yes stop_codon:yes gene_type:complete